MCAGFASRRLDELFQDKRVVVQMVFRRVKQGHALVQRAIADRVDQQRLVREFRPVALSKSGPAIRFVPEPFPKFCAGREIRLPVAQRGTPFADTSRPQAVDENPEAVRPRGGGVNALEAQVTRCDEREIPVQFVQQARRGAVRHVTDQTR